MNGESNSPGSHGFGDPRPQLLASRRHALRFIFIVGGIALAGLINSRHLAAPSGGSRALLYLSIVALQLLFTWFVRLGIRARGGHLRELLGTRWRKPWDAFRDITLALLFVFALRVASPFLQHLLGQSSANTAFLLPQGPIESVLWIAVSLAAGFCEELIYRGYLQRQLWAISGSLILAIGSQAIIFAAGHAYQGWRPALITGVYGLAFGFLAAWRRSIIPGAIAHTLVDVISGFLPR